MTDRIEQLQKLLAAEPDDTFCLYALAQEYAKTGDHDRAIEHYDRVIAVDPDHCYAYFHKARSLEDADKIEAALAVLETGLARATAIGDGHAASELQGYLDTIE